MKVARISGILIFLLLLAGCSGGDREDREITFTSNAQKFSYIMGLEVVDNLKKLETEIDEDAFVRGVRDRFKDRKSLIPPMEIQEIKNQVYMSEKQAREKRLAEQGEKNLEESRKFFAENAKKEGVIVTESGLQYMVLSEGSGPRPTNDDIVRLHYHGTLINGAVFDSTYIKGEPAVLPVNRLVPGWAEGLKLMKTGSRFRFYIPPELAYKDQQASELIGPNTTLIIEVELIAIEPQ